MENTMVVNGRKYRILRLLGKGKGGYSYLAQGEAGEVVLKQIHHEPCDYYQFGDKLASELRDYERLRAVGVPMPELLDVDRAQERLIKAYVPGATVYEMVLRNALPEVCLEAVRRIAELLKRENLNIDYFPTNFIWHDGTLFYVDYECNAYMEQWNFENWGIKYWFQSPEFLAYAAGHGDGIPCGEER